MGGKSEEGLHKGRQPGSRNKRTIATLELAQEGETPCAFALRLMRDNERSLDVRLSAARIAAPYFHPKPQPEGRVVAFELPELIDTPQELMQAHAAILRAVAGGKLSLDAGKDISQFSTATGALLRPPISRNGLPDSNRHKANEPS